MPDLRITAIVAAATMATIAAGAAVAAIAMGGEDRSREIAVAERGAKVMPFSLDATTHVFDATATGGIQRVVADDARDVEQLRLVREHLREEAAAFQRGDFGDPSSIHGEDMPGLAALEAGFERIEVSYRDLPDGAEIAHRTDDRVLAAAVADWFDAQLRDHGSDATKGEPQSDSDHSDHSSHGR